MENATLTSVKPKPFVLPEFCKGCGRCLNACPKHCISLGTQVNAESGLVPVVLNLETCNGCGLCMIACPEPYGLSARMFDTVDPCAIAEPRPRAIPRDLPAADIPMRESDPLVIKGTYAAAIGAILAGCRHFFGYPITPSTEGAELMAKLLPKMDGVFVQACSEVAAVNYMYGCAGAGQPCMTFTSSPGFSLMLEGISYMIGAELPGVFVDVMRGGPGLGNIGPEQGDIKLVCHGLGHGNTHAIVLAPSSPQEMLDLTMLAFDLTFAYRNPVIIVGDGYMGQMTGKVTLPKGMRKPGLPAWAVSGDRDHRGNLICSIYLEEKDLEEHNLHLNEKYFRMNRREQRADCFYCDDADLLLVACNTPARMAKGAVQTLRHQGMRVGLFRPITLWPFPIDALRPLLNHTQRILVVEAGNGQLEDELRLALQKADVAAPPIEHLRRYGGILPSQDEIVHQVQFMEEVRV